MIFGIGVDQVDLNRVRKLLAKSQSKFEKRCFTENEKFMQTDLLIHQKD